MFRLAVASFGRLLNQNMLFKPLRAGFCSVLGAAYNLNMSLSSEFLNALLLIKTKDMFLIFLSQNFTRPIKRVSRRVMQQGLRAAHCIEAV